MTNRPWGTYTVLHTDNKCNIKTIEIMPGKQPSYQYHHKRAEHWIILQGQAEVTLDEVTSIKGVGDYIFVPVGSKHRIKNLSEVENLIFVEVQTGTYFGEDDIVRLDDDFGRA
jgi:mannose-6-phosphate isomerase-like protein (cupin superfamily)